MANSAVNYKYCIVPQCKSTTIATPGKEFLAMPKDREIRRKWCLAMKRDDKKNPPLSTATTRFVCEDHFDLKNDLANYVRFSLQGGSKHLKKGVVPHIFHCQKPPVRERKTGEKRRRIETINEAMSFQPSSSQEPDVVEPDFMEPDFMEPSVSTAMNEFPTEVVIQFENKGVQVKPPLHNKSTKTDDLKLKSTASSPMKMCVSVGCGTSPKTNHISVCSSSSSESVSSETLNSDDSFVASSESDIELSDTDNFKLSMRQNFVLAITLEPRLCMGVPKECLFIIPFLASKTKCSELNIMITLKKIRLNDSYATLSLHFGMSISNISRIFNETCKYLSNILQEFVFWPDAGKVRENLPIAFRSRYKKVMSIIDCFEVEIEKPSSSKHQAMTWSAYKKCNTLKYLISCTPDGLVSFISQGYGGRTTDKVIVEKSGYLEKLSTGIHVMADRGFKFLSTSLHQRGCELVRPPSVSADSVSTKNDVICTKQIAALRIHVERVIGRLRVFNMLLPHSS